MRNLSVDLLKICLVVVSFTSLAVTQTLSRTYPLNFPRSPIDPPLSSLLRPLLVPGPRNSASALRGVQTQAARAHGTCHSEHKVFYPCPDSRSRDHSNSSLCRKYGRSGIRYGRYLCVFYGECSAAAVVLCWVDGPKGHQQGTARDPWPRVELAGCVDQFVRFERAAAKIEGAS